MGFQIQDGTGKGYVTGVDSKNRLLTATINETTFQHAAEQGDAFFLGTPTITLTNAAASAIFFIENNEDQPLTIGEFLIMADATTGGSPAAFKVSWYKNPTDISGTTISALNQNFGSSNELDATIKYGLQGSVVSGGELVATLSFPIGQFNRVEVNLVLEKGSSFALTVTPPTGNSSMPVTFGARSILFDRN
jgi:hypothetical protein